MQHGYNSQLFLTYNPDNIVGYTKVSPPEEVLQTAEHVWKYDLEKQKWKQQPASDEYLVQIKHELISQVHALRKFYEVKGIIVTDFKDLEQFVMGTDEDDKSALTNTILSMSLGLISSVNWKTCSGTWIPLNLSELTQIASLVIAYVEECFDVEMDLILQISELMSLSELNTFKMVTLYTAWPPRIRSLAP